MRLIAWKTPNIPGGYHLEAKAAFWAIHRAFMGKRRLGKRTEYYACGFRGGSLLVAVAASQSGTGGAGLGAEFFAFVPYGREGIIR